MSTSPLPTKQKTISKLVAGDIIQEGNYITGFHYKTFIRVLPKADPKQRWRRIFVTYNAYDKESSFIVNVRTRFNVVIKIDPEKHLEKATRSNI